MSEGSLPLRAYPGGLVELVCEKCGRPRGSRNKLSEDFFRDLCEAWQAFGKPALETMAMLYPVEFVRMAASLMPRELEATTTPVMERLSDAQLDAMIARCIEDGLDPAATD